MAKSSGFTVKIKMNSTSKILKDHGLDKDGRVTEFFRDTVYRLYEPYVPRESGNLYRKVTFQNAHSITHIEPYSHYHYKGKKAVGASRPKGIKRTISNQDMKYQGAPKRGPEWDKRMMNDRGLEVCKDVERFIKNGGK